MAINSIGETRNFPCVLSGLFSYIYTVLIDAFIPPAFDSFRHSPSARNPNMFFFKNRFDVPLHSANATSL